MKGILFKPWKIQAIAANTDREWQTRRVIKPCSTATVVGRNSEGRLDNAVPREQPDWVYTAAKPRYHAGETVYVKESHYAFGEYKVQKDKVKSGRYAVRFSHTGNGIYFLNNAPKNLLTATMGSEAICDVDMWFLRSPLFLEARFARYFIQITGVTTCRTKGITSEDCLAEGIERHEDSGHNIFWFEPIGDYHSKFQRVTAHESYFALYDSINGDGAHERNWDWVYKFVTIPRPLAE